MKQIVLIRRDHPECEASGADKVNLLSLADEHVVDELDITIKFLKSFLKPDVEIHVQDVRDKITHHYEYSNLKRV